MSHALYVVCGGCCGRGAAPHVKMVSKLKAPHLPYHTVGIFARGDNMDPGGTQSALPHGRKIRDEETGMVSMLL